MKTYTTIKGLSDSRRMPRLNKIRLGAKIQKVKNQGKQNESTVEFPVELPFFLLPDDVAAVHGGKIENIADRAKFLGATRADVLKFVKENADKLAEELPVMIPVEDTAQSFPQAYKMYGGSIGLKCVGDGEEAQERVGITKEFKARKCPCNQLKSDTNPKGACTIKANLQVMLPEVSAGGVYQLDIGSINSIIDINSGIEYIRQIIGRIAMIPMKLRRIPMETHHEGKKQIHFTCQLTFEGNIHAIADMRENLKILTHHQVLQLDAPDDSDPTLDKPDAAYTQPEHIGKMLDELRVLAENKKVTVGEGKAIAAAIDDNDDQAIEEIHKQVLARIPTGKTQDQTADKLKGKQQPTKEEQKAGATDAVETGEQSQDEPPPAAERF